jgi:hypothetical protein
VLHSKLSMFQNISKLQELQVGVGRLVCCINVFASSLC